MRRRSFLTALATAAAFAPLTACSGGSGQDSAAGGSLALSQIQPPVSFIPGEMSTGPASQYFQPVYDSLLRLTPEAEPGANLATAWELDAAGTTLSLTLRDDVKFSDGTVFDAAAVKANLEKAKQGTGESGTQLRFLQSVTVVDATHIQLVLSAPDPSLLPNLGGSAGMVASPAALASADLATKPVGSGPYVLDTAQTVAGSKYVYTRHAGYWNTSAFPYDTVTITVYNDTNAQLNALRSGQLNGSNLTDTRNLKAAKAAGLTAVTYPSGATEGLYLFDRAGTLVPALGNPLVRQALNHAFDRKAILEQTHAGLGSATDQVFNADSTAYDASLEDVYPYDPDKAKALLAQAGYAKGFAVTMPDVSPIYPGQQAALTEGLQAIGITPTYEPSSADQFIPSLLSGKYALTFFSLDNFRSWDTCQLLLAADALWNPFRLADPTATELITQAQMQTGDEQAATFRKLNAYVVRQAWFVPWVHVETAYISTKDVKVTPQRFASNPPLHGFRPA